MRPGPLPLAFRGAVIDRVAGLRHDRDALRERLGRGDALAIATGDAHVLVNGDGDRLARLPWQGDPADAVLLGFEDGRPLVLVGITEPAAGVAGAAGASGTGGAAGIVGASGAAAAVSPRPVSLRDAGLRLDAAESGLAAYAVALANWHARHGYCSVCGHRSDVAEAGLSRRCPNCGASHFPRTDPVVIMSVEFDGRLLLGSRTGWSADRYSVLAGFVSPGETPEEAVIREVAEESGIVVRDPVYRTAQPWPFPASLMLGYHAVADGGDPVPGDDDELSAVRWFERAEVVAMQTGESPLKLPGEVSIARWLIDRWVAAGPSAAA